nr:hypothetical protein [Kibdelosporangium sp. MJ126-NF4]CEL19684.1 hypothetical protein [Kibdelosporangium sp. MJ126-NF4]
MTEQSRYRDHQVDWRRLLLTVTACGLAAALFYAVGIPWLALGATCLGLVLLAAGRHHACLARRDRRYRVRRWSR